MINKQWRIALTKNKINKITNLLLKVFPTKQQAGWFVTIFTHYLPHLIFTILLFMLPFNIRFLIIFIFGYLFHLFFNGCFHLRLERHLFNDKNWKGPYHILEYFNFNLNSKTIDTYLNIGMVIVFLIFSVKFYNKLKKNNFTLNISDFKITNNKIFLLLLLWWIIQIITFIII